jgi:MFS family permease
MLPPNVRIFITVDYFLQLFILIAAVLGCFSPMLIFALFLAAIPLGIVQVLSAIILSLIAPMFRKTRIWYLLYVVIALTSIFLFTYLLDDAAWGLVLVGFACAFLALYYFVLTYNAYEQVKSMRTVQRTLDESLLDNDDIIENQ